MDLILWRHAQAQARREGLADVDRALTPKGQRQAERMAEWLNRRLADSTRVIASPARRCQQTAQALGRDFRTFEAIGAGADPDAVLKAAHWPDAGAAVLVVGHQPTLGLVAAQLLGAGGRGLAIRKGAVWWLRRRAGDAVLQLAIGPADL